MQAPQHTISARLVIKRQVDGVDTDTLADQTAGGTEPISTSKMEQFLAELSANALEEYGTNI